MSYYVRKSISLDSYWLICEETRNEVEVNAPRVSILGLFGFRKMTYSPRRREQLYLKVEGGAFPAR